MPIAPKTLKKAHMLRSRQFGADWQVYFAYFRSLYEIEFAASYGHLRACQKLILYGADALLPSNAFGNSAIKNAQKEGHEEVAAFLEDFKDKAIRMGLANMDCATYLRK